MDGLPLLGRMALVTGGSGDIGGGIVRALANAGADVAITYLGHSKGAEATLQAVEACDRRGILVQLDQRDPTSIDACVRKLTDEAGRLEILVNNAAWNIGIPFADLDRLDTDTWDRVLETNLRGPFLLARGFARLLKASGAGHIVNIASTGGIAPASSSVAYSASKAGLIHLTRCLAVAMAPDVAVNCVAPGLVEGTRMAKRLPEEVVRMAQQQALLGRPGQIGDIARHVLTFVTSTSISGQVIAIDGGLPMAMR